MKNVTVVGLGIIGGAWAKNLHADGLAVRAWNRTPKDLPYYERDLVKAVTGAEMVIIVVADPPAVEEILNVIVPHLKAGQLVMQSSTISAYWTRIFCQRVEEAGATFLEAPFTGSKPAAEKRETVFYVGGPEETLTKARPVLERLSKQIIHIGKLGTASSLKLAMNLNLALMAEALSESLLLARAEEIPDEKFFEALHGNVGRSGLADLKEPKLRAHDYSPQFALKHMGKDLRLAMETAQGINLPTGSVLKALYDKAIREGHGNEDFVGLIHLLEAAK